MKLNFKFFHQMRVRFAETDMQGVVFNGNYFIYLDVAWTEYFRAIGLPYDYLRQQGIDAVLARTTVEFKIPARFDDMLNVYTRVTQIGTTSMLFDFEVYKSGEDLAIVLASSLYVFINPETQQPIRVPDILREQICNYEGRRFKETSLQNSKQ